jgi:hypothetical protein
VKSHQEFANTFVQRNGKRKNLDMGEVNTKRRNKYAQSLLARAAKEAPTDENMNAVLSFPVGRRLFPKLAQYVGPAGLVDSMLENARKVIKTAGGRHKRELVQLLCDGLPKSFAKKALNVSESMWKRSLTGPEEGKTDRDGRHAAELGIGDVLYKADVHRLKQTEAEEYMLCRYFYSSTIQVSGADTGTRIQDKPFYEWEADLHANYPSLIRRLAGEWPQLQPTKTDDNRDQGWTAWEANVLSAMHAGRNGVDEKLEREQRRKEFLDKYRRRLEVKRGDMEA